MIEFLLGSTLVSETSIDPNTTVLNYLRRQRGRIGTKEGCASGDCGACTVVVAEVEDDRLRYRSVNACLTLLSALHGRQLLTVEDLRQQGQLHPVQQALVKHHASQCGFCTPGIAMSLFALHKHPEARHSQALSGNLCRCTGYRPVADAARECDRALADSFSQDERQTVARLRAIAGPTTLTGGGHHCQIPADLAQLDAAIASAPDARLMAGGTDLALEITQHRRVLSHLIDISQVAELHTLEARPDNLLIGAAVTLSDCETFLQPHLPAFSKMLTRFASRQIRNRGTLGGNLANASPIGDGAPTLLALGARLRLRCRGQERELPLEQFFLSYRQTALQPGEYIRQIVIPRPATTQRLLIAKVSKRREDDISAVFAACLLELCDEQVASVRLAYGGMAAIPARAAGAEAALLGRRMDASALADAAQALAQDFAPISDLRASSHYRLRVAQNLLRRFALSSHLSAAQLEVDDYV
ncbi:xanthine dehydrogenase small subunit|uniref:Xanthine dehydrogenase small subunit n=1 Tax=Brenneria salicis ATCC 15712 = DSM 30166 TaxID=714314 RepID=A0A366I5G8_9GAMM|nr:xanthine dehydrogenase small subunit [Brenneria salicis]NMN90221.1 xanthine dehydrogenase small subunit [Brenneria salicis ATCC 15712 = DSM 30166]RBP62155.1 xanthine dehydrogenase small subunit [Brenneria salicis ATCC 15712 = DSM 30166]RLM31194.1 xanthine dehydrogenase small subunit [Brenneria salicis ATCC 15712 = DSM 30166]